jgi:hypothetical protein
MPYSVHPVSRSDEWMNTRVLTVIVRNAGDEAHLYGHAHAQASPVVGPVAVAAAGSCGGGDRGSLPSAVGGWRGVDQYVKIESDATHPAIPLPPPSAPLPSLSPWFLSTIRQLDNATTTAARSG